MFGSLSKTLYVSAIASIAAAMAIAYEGGNRAGVVLLLFSGVAIGALGASLALFGEREALLLDGTSRSDHTPVKGGSSPSVFPAVVALGLVGASLGFVLGPVAFGGAVLVIVIGAAGWYGRTIIENSAWNQTVAERVNAQLAQPFVMPVVAAGSLGVVALCVSRILLAASRTSALVVASAGSTLLLLGGILAAVSVARGSRRVPGLLLAGALVSVFALGIVGLAGGERIPVSEYSKGRVPKITIVALENSNAYDVNRINIPVAHESAPRPTNSLLEAGHNGVPFEIEIKNTNKLAFHNMSFYTKDPSIGGEAVFQGGWIAPNETARYYINYPTFVGQNSGYLDANPDGTPQNYFWRCDIHPNMAGYVEVPAVETETHGTESHEDDKSHEDNE